jgi:hypothetical protein
MLYAWAVEKMLGEGVRSDSVISLRSRGDGTYSELLLDENVCDRCERSNRDTLDSYTDSSGITSTGGGISSADLV